DDAEGDQRERSDRQRPFHAATVRREADTNDVPIPQLLRDASTSGCRSASFRYDHVRLGYCRARWTRSSDSGSWISSPLTSRVTLCSVPVKANGPSYAGVTGEPGLAPQVRAPGLNMNGVVIGASALPTSVPST